MNKYSWKELKKMVDARTLRERIFLFAAVLVVIGYSWLIFVLDNINAGQAESASLITDTAGQINRELTRNQNIQDSYTTDPNAFVRTRLQNLEGDLAQVDAQLLELYGELILPQQMAGVLTDILQSETTLKLVSFENQPPTSLLDALTADQVTGQQQMNVYRHGLRLEFEGDYLETIRFLKKVEQLDSSFFWDNLSFNVIEYPLAKISLNIFTLSTARGFIGV